MPVIDPEKAELLNRSGYPAPHAAEMKKRWSKRLGDIAGLTQFGVNLVTIEPGGMSSLRHWHEVEDEFLYMIEGELVLVENGSETVMNAGDMAGFKAGDPNGHHLVNRSQADAKFLVVGTRSPNETAHYSDIDMIFQRKDGRGWFTHRNGKFIKEA
jgi:uncharacterized cupin superfamily protein